MKYPAKMKSYFLLFPITLLIFSCDDEDDGAKTMENDASKTDIVDTAINTEVLGSLVAALTKTDENEDSNLVDALSGKGSFTVFAPTNDVFVALLDILGDDYNSLPDFDTPEEKELLATVLSYHIISGSAIASGEFDDHQQLKAAQGENITVDVKLNGKIILLDKTHDRTRVDAADNEASNGIVHIIDKVLLPQEVLDALH